MQNGKLKLKEIIWEMVGRCENHCEYCGSKDAWNQKIDEKLIVEVAKKIALYPPEEIDMSGGDPLLVSLDTHKSVTNILGSKGIKCKILANPKSLTKLQVIDSLAIEKLRLYDWIGFSLNEKEDIETVSHMRFNDLIPKSTIITNFNLQNIFIYNDIEEFVKQHNLMWQIQYTMYRNQDEKLALYNNEKAIQVLSEKVSKSWNDGRRILVADNANAGSCGAGINSLGILSDGSVVPCLSMRSWAENINSVVVGKLVDEEWKADDKNYDAFAENPLKFIWEHRFDSQRFGSFKCCKDHCKNVCLEMVECGNTDEPCPQPIEDSDLTRKILYGLPRETFPGSRKVYGVPYNPKKGKKNNLPPTFVYGVPGKNREVIIYSVPGGWDESTYVYATPGDFGSVTSIYSVKSDDPTIITGTSTNSNDLNINNKKDDNEKKDK